MAWSDYLPSAVALLGIPLSAIVTLWRENKLRARQELREDAIRSQQQEREDKLFRRRQDEWISQRWWERKATTYSEIVESLWQIVEADAHEYEHEIIEIDREENPTVKEERSRTRQENLTHLRKAADIGAFVISDEVATILKRYFDDIEGFRRLDTYFEYIDSHYAASRKCLEVVRVNALRDLSLHREAVPAEGPQPIAETPPGPHSDLQER
jgi:hypothetical protein